MFINKTFKLSKNSYNYSPKGIKIKVFDNNLLNQVKIKNFKKFVSIKQISYLDLGM